MTAKRRPSGQFDKGSSGRPKGTRDRRTVVGAELLRGLAEKHAEPTLERLLSSKSDRVRFETIRWLLEMMMGKPRQSVDVAGLGDLAGVLAAKLRAVTEATVARMEPVGLVIDTPALEAPGAPLQLIPPTPDEEDA